MLMGISGQVSKTPISNCLLPLEVDWTTPIFINAYGPSPAFKDFIGKLDSIGNADPLINWKLLNIPPEAVELRITFSGLAFPPSNPSFVQCTNAMDAFNP